MQAVYNDTHHIHAPKQELHNGIVGEPYETPRRAEMILAELKKRKTFELIDARQFGFEHIGAVHDWGYLRFLESAWREWHDLGREGGALPSYWAAGSMRTGPPPLNLDGRLGYYSFSGDSAITPGTWDAAVWSANTALTGMDLLLCGEKEVFSLCRPPGHHAAADLFGGYCYINNAAVSAQYAIDSGASRVSILDIDYHHGNGTQDIFYARRDVSYLSIHADPLHAYPFFTGFADQTGSGEGRGFTGNYPLEPGSSPDLWFGALSDACRRISEYNPDICIVSLGVDTFEKDPISSFRLRSDDFFKAGSFIGELGIPTLFVMEGGYDVDAVGVNVCNVLDGCAKRKNA